jgi:hypothetical protein
VLCVLLEEGAGVGACACSPDTPRQNIASRVADHFEIFNMRVSAILAYP